MGSYPISEEENVVEEFETFLKDAACPMSVRISYERARLRYLNEITKTEPVASEMAETTTDDSELNDFLTLVSTFNVPKGSDEFAAYGLEVGIEYDWGSNIPEVCVCAVSCAISYYISSLIL
jgi:hypothetical protein